MAKRIITKIGNIFCVELDGGAKAYFQYIANDLYNLNSSVIRAFKTHYPLDCNPTMTQIVSDEVAFYAHTVLRAGIQFGAWYKVGKSSEIGETELKKVIFGHAQAHKTTFPEIKIEMVDPLKNWWIWHVNEEHQNVGKLPKKYWNSVEPGVVFPYFEIVNRMKYGFYKRTSDETSIVKRKPRPEVIIYIKTTENKDVSYYQFHGDQAIRQLIVKNGKVIRLTADKPKADGERLRKADFGDTNWLYQNFIEKEEFDRAWNENIFE